MYKNKIKYIILYIDLCVFVTKHFMFYIIVIKCFMLLLRFMFFHRVHFVNQMH